MANKRTNKKEWEEPLYLTMKSEKGLTRVEESRLELLGEFFSASNGPFDGTHCYKCNRIRDLSEFDTKTKTCVYCERIGIKATGKVNWEIYDKEAVKLLISRLIKESDLTDEELAEEFGASPTSVADWKHKRIVPSLLEHYERMAQHWNTTVKDLLIGDDIIKRPSHYTWRGVECIEMMQVWLEQWEIDGAMEGYIWGNIIKYLYRSPMKNGQQDIEKAVRYREHLLDAEGYDYVAKRWNDLITSFKYDKGMMKSGE
ncbi:DUF3310 domain-containing protein [Aerococcaceae bacterium DSM 111020]|nr:DUF3310 domain-containing protein [Aerococcaceae bacterium DSM 111020]